MTEETTDGLSRRAAAGLVAAITLLTLALNLWGLRYGLPSVFQSDFVQAEQAVDLLRDGVMEDRSGYTLPLVYAYAAADLAAYGVGHALGWEGYASWPRFVAHVSRREVHHAIGRALGAAFAALLALAVYRLARVRFGRDVAVLAAAIAAFSPLQTIYSHQIRPHVPVVTLVALAAPAVLRSVLQPSLRAGLVAGAGVGLVNAVFQVGVPYIASAAAMAALLVRPLRRIPTLLLGLGLGFGAGWLLLHALAYDTGLATPGPVPTGELRGSPGGLRFGMQDVFSQLDRFPRFAWQWLQAEPLCVAGALAFVLLCVLHRRSWRDALLYGTPALVIPLAVLVIHVSRPRYAMYGTPFIAPLAASACLAVRPRVARAALAALLVLVPLASSVRHDLLVTRTDTRQLVVEVLESLSRAGLRVSIEAASVPGGTRLPAGVGLFPPRGDFRPWIRKLQTPRQTFEAEQPDVFVRRRDEFDPTRLSAAELGRLDYVPAARLGADRTFLPDEPANVLPELWQADRPGPPLELWVRAQALERARDALPGELLTSSP